MTKDLETKISKLVESWNWYQNAPDERTVQHFEEEMLNDLDCAMEQYLKDTNSKNSWTYEYIIDEMPNSDGKMALDRICKISNIIGTDELNDKFGACDIDENFYNYIEKKITLMKNKYDIMEEAR